MTGLRGANSYPEAAIKELQTAVELDPKYADAQ